MREPKSALKAIAGSEDARYPGERRGGTPLSARNRALIEQGQKEIVGMTVEQLDHLERVLSGSLALVIEQQELTYWKSRDWRGCLNPN